MKSKSIVIGHRGASGYVPEHTLTSYFIAIQDGADYVEPDLVMTKDAVLVARHENNISGTTDIAEHPEFAGRKTTKTIDTVQVTGWFTEDFTLAELKTLRAKERLPQLRSSNTRLDGRFEVATLDEILAFVSAMNAQRVAAARREGRPPPAPIGIYPETKHPSYFDGLGLSLEKPLLHALHRYGYTDEHAPVFIQSFEVSNLKALRKMTQLPLVQLIDVGGRPYDFVAKGDARTYTDLISMDGLAEIATYADAIGVHKDLIIARTPDGSLGTPTGLVRDAHTHGLMVHAWTFRAENFFLPRDFRSGSDPAQFGDLARELNTFLATGMDGLFIDQPHLGVQARDQFVASH